MKLHSLQALRAIAAWVVIVDHALQELTNNQAGNPLTHLGWTMGGIGVNLFFVISGFIMVQISWETFGRPASSANFLRRRLIRIVPLYWIATFAALAYHRVSATHGEHAGWPELIHSLAFIPFAGEDGSWAPILGQGWTLNYEMMFYAIFAVGLFLRRQIALPAVGTILGAFVFSRPLLSNPTWAYLASPLVLWFVWGMARAVLWRWGGVNEPQSLAKLTRVLEPLGDASYSTYLVHGFVLTIILRVWVLLAGPPSLWIVPVSLVIATIAGWLTHLGVEKPILRLANNFSNPS